MTDLVDFALTTHRQDDGSPVVALAGEVGLHRALADALHAAAGGVVVDRQQVTFLDSATAISGIDRILTIRSAEAPSRLVDSRAT